ncbi:MAG: phosphatase PAP2 family protein [Phaeodactylibacter sp.]|nr:phosphatase PAP2 family protein [Phaeodactylibacter sp.]
MLNDLLQLDLQLFHLINGEWHHPWLDAVLPLWREKKTWLPFYVLLAGFLFFKYRWKGLILVAAVGLTVGLADIVSSKLLKKNVGRLRPCQNTEVRAETRLLVGCGRSYSFTSSHAANHFAMAAFLALTLGRAYRRLRWPLLLWAGSIAYSQVYVGVHYPLDVFFGALVGILIAYIMAKLYLRWDAARVDAFG